MTALPPAQLHIDLGALAANYRALCRIAAPGRVSAVVKANAYGLGVGPVAAALVAVGCDTFFVSSLAEGLELRALQPTVRVLVLELIPLFAALFVALRSGAAINTEVTLMHIRGDFDAQRRAGVDPLRRELVPRVIGSAVSVLALASVSGVIALVRLVGQSTGAALVALALLGEGAFALRLGRSQTAAA